MLFPIAGVPISIESMTSWMILSKHVSKEATEHWARTLRSVWRRIPRVDQEIMVNDIGEYNNRRLSVWFIMEWELRYDTNGFFSKQDGVIAIDAGYAEAADSRHLGATIAHELAHYRDFSEDN